MDISKKDVVVYFDGDNTLEVFHNWWSEYNELRNTLKTLDAYLAFNLKECRKGSNIIGVL